MAQTIATLPSAKSSQVAQIEKKVKKSANPFIDDHLSAERTYTEEG